MLNVLQVITKFYTCKITINFIADKYKIHGNDFKTVNQRCELRKNFGCVLLYTERKWKTKQNKVHWPCRHLVPTIIGHFSPSALSSNMVRPCTVNHVSILHELEPNYSNFCLLLHGTRDSFGTNSQKLALTHEKNGLVEMS